MTLFLAHIWPFMASNAAVPLSAAILGHLPGEGMVAVLGTTISEGQLVKALGFAVFGASLLLLLFGGTVYRMLEAVMTIMLVVLLVFLLIVNVLLVSWADVREVLTGFVRFGSVPIRADTVIAGKYFSMVRREGASRYQLQGSVTDGRASVFSFEVFGPGGRRVYDPGAPLAADAARIKNEVVSRAADLVRPGNFYVEVTEPNRVAVRGLIDKSQWIPTLINIGRSGNALLRTRDFSGRASGRIGASMEDCPI